ncbi:class I SAM-dependent methyltransferase [Arenimonas sp.]|uniref:class I SAM-dependent methyltransferase n=1 Tax=Arenimonas sp. TaxID=1872635 RepID=UPI002E3549BC|nr:class I SAM-dependent methyltransferase [Arenimonas sp.]HEX4854990.1 class I SAM-dependent methyltransferase [Arenimonas sp.]
MAEPEFDRFAKDYDRVLADAMPAGMEESGYFVEYKVAVMARRLRGRPVRRILDFGCGAGRSLPFLRKYFPDSELWGYDVSPASLAAASAHCPGVTLCADASALAGASFDAILAANVFHHIEPADRVDSLVRCRDALGDDGRMFLFEHNPRNPVTRWVFERCAFDVDAEMFSLATALELAGRAGLSVEHRAYTLFFPRPLAWLRGLEPMLARVPVGAQYYVQLAR